MTPLTALKFLFDLGGFLAGYKTYIVAAAGVLSVTAQFFTSVVIPFTDGDITTLAMLTERIPEFVAAITPFLGLGTLRAGIQK